MKNKKDIEIEYKFWVENKDELIETLNKKTSQKKPRQYQSNVMFDNSDSLMQTTNGRIRVRTLRKTEKKQLTYKKPLSPQNGAKKEIEYEIVFQDNDEQIEKILQAMGFKPTTSYERYQTKWQINNISITLDEYPFANVVEIEGKQSQIKQLAEELKFDPKKGLTKPIDTLFQEWRKEKNLPFKPHMRFKDFDK